MRRYNTALGSLPVSPLSGLIPAKLPPGSWDSTHIRHRYPVILHHAHPPHHSLLCSASTTHPLAVAPYQPSLDTKTVADLASPVAAGIIISVSTTPRPCGTTCAVLSRLNLFYFVFCPHLPPPLSSIVRHPVRCSRCRFAARAKPAPEPGLLPPTTAPYDSNSKIVVNSPPPRCLPQIVLRLSPVSGLKIRSSWSRAASLSWPLIQRTHVPLT